MADSGRSGPGPSACGQRLFGREAEMAALAAVLDSPAEPHHTSLFFGGAAGTGKSALLAWPAAEAGRRDWTVLTARASVLEASNSFGVLRQLLAPLPSPPAGSAAVALGPAPADRSAFQVFEQVSAHLIDAGVRGPVLITVDDLQWCDPPSLRWLAYLASRCAGLPIVLVLAGPPGERTERQFLIDELVALCTRHTLGRLERAQLQRWAASVLGAPPDEASVDECLDATGGNAALLADVLATWAGRPRSSAQELREILGTTGLAAVSPRVLQWIKRGGPGALAVAQAVAVLGDDSNPVLVARLAGSRLDDRRPGPALRCLRRSLAEPMPDPTRAGLLAHIGSIEAGLGTAGARDTLWRALAVTAEPSQRVRIAVDLAYVDAVSGSPLRPAIDVIDEASAQLPAGGAAGEAEFGVFAACAAAGDVRELLSRGLPRIRELADGSPHLAALAGLADAWSGARRGRDRAGCVRRALAAQEAVGQRCDWEARLRWPAASTLVTAEEYDRADTSGRFAHRQGPAGDTAFSAHLRGWLAHGRGDLTAARTELEAALGNPPAAGTAGAARLVQVLIDLGELDAAEHVISEHSSVMPAGQTWAAAVLVFARAPLCMARAQYREALDGFLDSGRTLTGLGTDNPSVMHWRSRAARCHALLGDRDAAMSLAAAEAELARNWGSPRALSTALATAGVVGRDPDTTREAVAVLDGIEAGLQRAAALADLGAVLQETGAADQAHGHLQAGYALARTIGAKPTWQQAARHLRHLGGRPDLSLISGVNALTAQERAVAERAAAGATNRQIADEMVLTQRTVEQYLTGSYRMLGIPGRSQLAAALAR